MAGRGVIRVLSLVCAIGMLMAWFYANRSPKSQASSAGQQGPKQSIQEAPVRTPLKLDPKTFVPEEDLKRSAQIQTQLELLTYLLQEGQDDEFLRRLQKLIDEQPKTAEYRALLADYYYLRQNWIGAETALEDVLKLDPKNLSVKAALGEVIGIQGRYDEGLEEMNQVLSEDSTQLDALFGTLSLHELRGSLSEGHSRIAELYSQNPQSGNLAIAYADVLSAQGRKAERREVLANAMRSDPQNEGPFRYAAEDAQQSGDYKRAAELAEAALSRAKEVDQKIHSLEILVRSATEAKDWDLAERYLTEKQKMAPWDEATMVEIQQIQQSRKN